MKKIITILLILGLTGLASAEVSNVGSAGAQFLKIGVGSRYQAMGEASVATAGDVYAMYWNPAGLTAIENGQVSFTRVNWLLDIDLNYIGFAKYFEDVGVFGVSATVLSMGEQEVTRADEPDGTGERFDASSYAIGLTFARQLTSRFSFGVTAKYVGERIWEEKASGVAFDFGTLLHTGFKSLRFGMSISNMGPEMQFSSSEFNSDGNSAQYKTTPFEMPMVFRVGIAYDFEFNRQSMLTMAMEMKHPNDQLQQGSLGAEYGFEEKYFVRGGYKFNYDEEKLSLGAGIITSLGNDVSLMVDYSWQDFGRLNDTQKFSLGFIF